MNWQKMAQCSEMSRGSDGRVNVELQQAGNRVAATAHARAQFSLRSVSTGASETGPFVMLVMLNGSVAVLSQAIGELDKVH